MKNEYIIINKKTIQERIKELEDSVYSSDNALDVPKRLMDSREKFVLKEIMSKSTQLIPEIEKAWEDGKEVGLNQYGNPMGKQNYIENIKLDI